MIRALAERLTALANAGCRHILMTPFVVDGPCSASAALCSSSNSRAVAMRIYFRDTHNVVEGAGAATLAAALQERDALHGQTVGLIVTGGNVDTDLFRAVLAGETPSAV